MIKSTKMLKRLGATFLVVLMSIESFAAVVGDNDGAAFITKAEFDSMKNDFQSQLDRYNSSLDNKIDGAIASYLSGVTTAKKSDIKPGVENYNTIRWMHGPYNYLTTRTNTQFDGNGTVTNFVEEDGWQIIEMENRRQSSADMSLWYFDNISARTGELVVGGMFKWIDVCPKEWGYGTFPFYWTPTSTYNLTKRPPTLYIQAKMQDNGSWALVDGVNSLVGEWGVKDEIHTFPHWPELDSDGGWSGSDNSDSRRFTLTSALTDTQETLSLTQGPIDNANFADYTIGGLYTTTTGANRLGPFNLHSIVRLVDNPALFQSEQTEQLYLSGDVGEYCDTWRTGVSRKVNPSDPSAETVSYYLNNAQAKYKQHLWATKTQYVKDNENLLYAMFGTDIMTMVNIAPHQKKLGDYTYLDLSKSPNTVQLTAQPQRFVLSAVQAHKSLKSAYDYSRYLHGVEFDGSTSTYDNIQLTIPLFYRATWSEIKTDAFKNRFDKQPLAKGAGLPILVDAENAGTVTLSFDYEEDSNTDSSVVSCTPDQKIKTYFKTKNFLDKDGKYWSGWTNLNASGTGVSLNGTEWTGGEVKITIDVKKGDSIWMRIDPLTEDGVYCTMSNYKCNLTVE